MRLLPGHHIELLGAAQNILIHSLTLSNMSENQIQVHGSFWDDYTERYVVKCVHKNNPMHIPGLEHAVYKHSYY